MKLCAASKGKYTNALRTGFTGFICGTCREHDLFVPLNKLQNPRVNPPKGCWLTKHYYCDECKEKKKNRRIIASSGTGWGIASQESSHPNEPTAALAPSPPAKLARQRRQVEKVVQRNIYKRVAIRDAGGKIIGYHRPARPENLLRKKGDTCYACE